MENIIKDYCDYLVAYGNAVGVKTWVKKFMGKKLNDIRNKLKEKYPFFDEYYDYDYLYLAYYCNKNGLDFVKATTGVLNSESHDVYDYIDKLIYEKYSNEIVDTIRLGMSVELANGYRYDVVCNKAGQLEIVKHFHKNPRLLLNTYQKDGKYATNRLLNGLDIVAIYASTECSPEQKPFWKRNGIQCLDDLRNGMYVVFRCGIWGVVERNDNSRFRLVKDNHEIEEKFLAIEFTDTMHHTSNQDYDIVEVWQYGECIWREKG